jgi:signal transduction histidine kinase
MPTPTAWNRVLSLLVLLLIFWPAHAVEPMLVLRDARVQVTVGTEPAETYDVTLPHHWDRLRPGQAGVAAFTLAFKLADPPGETYAMYLPRIGNAYAIWLNGHMLQQKGDLTAVNGSDFAKAPRFVEFPINLLRPNNLIRVQIRADAGRRGGMSAITLGPESMVRPLYAQDYAWRITGSSVVVVVNLLVALIALALWWTQVERTPEGQMRRDSLYLFAGVAELSWTLRVADTLIENPPLSWLWWSMLTFVALTVWASSMMLFCVEVTNWRSRAEVRWLRRWLMLLTTMAMVGGYIATQAGQPSLVTAQYLALGLTAIGFLAIFVISTRAATLNQKMVAAALLVNVVVGMRDFVVFRLTDSYGGNTWMRYSSLLFGLALGYIVLARLRTATTQAHDLSSNMQAHVMRKEHELQQIYPRLEELARAQERSAERSRILRDMHDGVGSHIITAIRQLQSGKSSDTDILHTLRDSLDHLKLSIDAINVAPGDVGALLANIRYRLESRIQACGIELQWDVEDFAPIARLDVSAMGHLQFMVYEAFSNVLQHAQATRLRVAANPISGRAGTLHLQIIDNGTGYDTAGPPRNGRQSLQQRAQTIGVTLLLTSKPGHTVVEITVD